MQHDKYTIGCYLLDRLLEVGVKDMFGVPGDFNLRFLDDVVTHSIKWIGTANELNAAYAADGYARCNGIGCFLTTFGVGELSALNGVAGSFSESVPVIHIVGVPSYAQQNQRLFLHHGQPDGDFKRYFRMSAEICCVSEMLTPDKAREQIDRVITEVLYHKKPGLIGIPVDVAESVSLPPPAALFPRLPSYSEESLDALEEQIASTIEQARTACMVVGHLVDRFNMREPLHTFLKAVPNMAYVVATAGKGAVDETYENCVGTWIPGGSTAGTVFEESELTITIGLELADIVTGGFKHRFSHECIHIHPFEVTVGDQRFQQIPMHKAIVMIQEICSANQANWKKPTVSPSTFKTPRSSQHFDLAHMWREIQASLLPGDVIVADTGTSSFSSVLLRLPEGCMYVVQAIHGSIGYALPAALGCQVAFPQRRVLCIIGDGAAQMTAQEFGTVAREGLRVQYILVNNEGYTIERYIRGMNASYNDVTPWDWVGVAAAMCKTKPPVGQVVAKVGDLSMILSSTSEKMQLIEVVVNKFDPPLCFPVPLPQMPLS